MSMLKKGSMDSEGILRGGDVGSEGCVVSGVKTGIVILRTACAKVLRCEASMAYLRPWNKSVKVEVFE